jgi:hypothetical protein
MHLYTWQASDRGRGPPGAKKHCAKPVRYVDARRIAALALPKPKIAPW